MNGFLKIYTSSQTESQKTGYRNNFDFSILVLYDNGKKLPGFNLDATGTTVTVYLDELDTNQLKGNGIISVVSSTEITGFVTADGNGMTYALKQASPESLGEINKLYRYKIDVDGTVYYTDLFFDISVNMPVYRSIDELGNLRIT
ncbi:hypothetical protein [Massilibacteroides sp.]|uniref:hypothetical protein n=1 Tax=Massilibacteroides sp. TaxID=2034766 RepID=UPI00260A2F86|nr:hypothetical protein [Massilibacteroides sp.]MDD4515636.1 hypothetical protein [Massilibacteroides sp.]